MKLYCWQHNAAHELSSLDVEAIVYTLGGIASDGIRAESRTPDCPLEIVKLGQDGEGYAEHVEQGMICADPERPGRFDAWMSGETMVDIAGTLVPIEDIAKMIGGCAEGEDGVAGGMELFMDNEAVIDGSQVVLDGQFQTAGMPVRIQVVLRVESVTVQ